MRCTASAPAGAVRTGRSAPCRAARRSQPGARHARVCTAAASENAADEAPVLARRDALALAAATLACAVSVSAPAADAAGIELGLRRIGRSAKFDSIDLSKYTTLPSGLKYYDVVVGSGQVVKNGNRAAVHYDCKWRTLTVSTSRVGMGVTGGSPYGFDVGTKAGTPGGPFIEGMNQGVVGMQVGGQRKIIVPPELAYGKLQIQEIPPNATLTFDIELLSIKKDNPFGKSLPGKS